MEHSAIISEQCHEPKHITNATTSDAGKVITPSSTTDGLSVLRRISAGELVEGADVATYTGILANDRINPTGWVRADDNLAVPTQVFNTSQLQLLINSGGSQLLTHRPQAYAATSSSLYNDAGSRMIPLTEGDVLHFQVFLTVTALSTANPRLEALATSGGDVLAVSYAPIDFGVGQVVSLEGTFRASASAVASGVEIRIRTNAGTVTIGARSITVYRLMRGKL